MAAVPNPLPYKDDSCTLKKRWLPGVPDVSAVKTLITGKHLRIRPGIFIRSSSISTYVLEKKLPHLFHQETILTMSNFIVHYWELAVILVYFIIIFMKKISCFFLSKKTYLPCESCHSHLANPAGKAEAYLPDKALQTFHSFFWNVIPHYPE